MTICWVYLRKGVASRQLPAPLPFSLLPFFFTFLDQEQTPILGSLGSLRKEKRDILVVSWFLLLTGPQGGSQSDTRPDSYK